MIKVRKQTLCKILAFLLFIIYLLILIRFTNSSLSETHLKGLWINLLVLLQNHQ